MAKSKYEQRKGDAAAAIAAGKDHHQAAKTAGIHPSTLYRWLEKPDFQALIEEIHQENKDKQAQELSDIDPRERLRWRSYGPTIPGHWSSWSSWEEWAAVYERVREEYLAGISEKHQAKLRNPILAAQRKDKAIKIPAAERIYQAIRNGEDPAEEKARIYKEIKENDPRDILYEES